MADSTLHVVFNPSAAGSLRHALRRADRTDRVVSLSDCLSFGPIDPPDPELRSTWVEEKLGYTGWEDVVSETSSFWSEALSISERKIAWLSRRSAQDYAGFLAWLWRLGEETIEVIDLTDAQVVTHSDGQTERHLAICLGMLSADNILANALLDRAETLTSDQRAQYRALWRRLRTEDAPLRILSEGELVSAPLSFFDPLLLACASTEWKKAARVIGEALSDFLSTSVLQTGDLVLCARARALAAAGQLEFRGNLSDIHNSELRLPSSRTPMG
jgi:Protein of unknown function/Domain of unknown function (DUF1835)